MNKVRKNSIIILLITIGVLIYLLKDNFLSTLKVLQQANYLYLFIILILWLLYFLFDQNGLYRITKQYKKDISYGSILYLGIITKFFNGVTPLATGGQPLQVYYFTKKGIKATTGTNIIVQNYIVFQIALMLITTIAIICNAIFHIFTLSPGVLHLTEIGLIVNIGILVVLLFLGFSNKFIKKIIHFIINLLAKMKIIKEEQEVQEKWVKICNEYHENAKQLVANKKDFLLCIGDQLLSQLFYYLLPIAIAYSLNCVQDLTITESIFGSVLIYVMGCYIPIPGATGGMEYAFLGYFGAFVANDEIIALLLIWRFITYYLPTIVGAILFNIHIDNNEKEMLNEI